MTIIIITKDIHASKNGKLKYLLNLMVFRIAPELAQVIALNNAAN